jgi:methoxymalonate biosynthesis acyl carrier protein
MEGRSLAIKDEIRQLIVAGILKDDGAELSDDRPLLRDGLLNSIGIMKLITLISSELQIQFEDEDYNLDNFSTLNAISELVQKRAMARAVVSAGLG